MRGIAILLTSIPLFLQAGNADQCSLICKHGVQVEVGPDCSASIELDAILLGFGDPASCLSNQPEDFEMSFLLEREGAAVVAEGLPIPSEYLGEKLLVRVVEKRTGNFCFGSITTFDTQPPELICPASIALAFDEVAPEPGETEPLYDDCGEVTFTYEDRDIFTDCASGFYKKTIRIWTGSDLFGNRSNCEQEIGFRQPDLSAVIFPASWRDTFFDCSMDLMNTELLGAPKVDIGWGADSFNLLHLTSSFEDVRVEECSGNALVTRYWTVGNTCDGTTVEDIQEIQLRDTIGPNLICPDTISVNALEGSEVSPNFSLPAALAIDACSELIEYEGQMLGDTIEGNAPQLSDLPIGLVSYAYEAADECGNHSKCRSAIKVFPPEGYDYPVLLCQGLDTVTLNDLGAGVYAAENLIIETLDNRCMETFLVRKSELSAFESQVVFGCEDLGGVQLLSVEGIDCESSKGYCAIEIIVLDTIPPVLTCPPAQFLTCLDAAEDLDITGRAILTDVCSPSILTFSDVLNINDCGLGMINRIWEGGEDNGPTGSCEQTISIGPDVPFSIVFPRSYTFIGCRDSTSLLPENLPANYSTPVITSGICSDYTVSYRDSIFQDDLFCWVVFREWRVQDLCSFESAGIFEWIQLIRVIDNEVPIITCPDSVYIELPSDQCEATAILPPPVWEDECIEPLVELSGDLQGGYLQENLISGQYELRYAVTDGCQNTATCSFTLTVADASGPIMECPSTLSLSLGGDLTAQLRYEDLNITNLADNCFPITDLQFRLTFDVNDSVPPPDSILLIDCTTPAESEIRFWAGDPLGLWNSCVITLTVPNSNCANEEETRALQPIIYPNPAREVIYFNALREKEGLARLRIQDKFGRVVHNQSIHLNSGENQWEISTNHWPKGILVYQFMVDGQSSSGSILIIE
ncbi:MAG: hypothetical protein RLZZ248_1062 [Bacteroidota bacterium]